MKLLHELVTNKISKDIEQIIRGILQETLNQYYFVVNGSDEIFMSGSKNLNTFYPMYKVDYDYYRKQRQYKDQLNVKYVEGFTELSSGNWDNL